MSLEQLEVEMPLVCFLTRSWVNHAPVKSEIHLSINILIAYIKQAEFQLHIAII